MIDFIDIRFCLLACMMLLGGCSICDNCDDTAYSGYGGRWQRIDRYNGRVGSVFSEAGAPVAVNHGEQPVEILRSPETTLHDSIDYPQQVEFPDVEDSNSNLTETDPSVLELMPPILEAY